MMEEKMTKYVLLKRCTNCTELNPKTQNQCVGCGFILFGEMDQKDWEVHCTELQKKVI